MLYSCTRMATVGIKGLIVTSDASDSDINGIAGVAAFPVDCQLRRVRV